MSSEFKVARGEKYRRTIPTGCPGKRKHKTMTRRKARRRLKNNDRK